MAVSYTHLREDGLRCCILKGQGNALMYPNPYSRTPGDIDVWIDADVYKSQVVISADWDGLLTGESLDFDSKCRLDERHPQCKRSLRTCWITTDLMNYEAVSYTHLCLWNLVFLKRRNWEISRLLIIQKLHFLSLKNRLRKEYI